MPYTLPPITLTQNRMSLVTIPGALGSVTYLKLVNASPYLLSVNNLLGGSDYMQPGEANVWPVPGLSTAVQVTPQAFGISPAIIPSTVLVVTWYLEGEKPNGNYPVNFNTISFLGSSVTTNASTPNSVNQDEWTPFVLGATSFVATKDGTFANQLDVTGGVAWLRQADQSLGRVAENATTFTTVQINSTYFLDLNPDGTFSFTTSHSGQPNYLPIAQVTTDASGNIAAVTDERTLNTQLLQAMLGGGGEIITPPLSVRQSGIGAGFPSLLDFTPAGASVNNEWGILYAGGDGRLLIEDQTGGHTAIQISPGGAVGFNSGVGLVGSQSTAGSFGVPGIVAQTIRTNVTTTASQTILSFTPTASGLYRANGYVRFHNSASQSLTANISYNDPDDGATIIYFSTGDVFASGGNPVGPILLDGSNAVGTTVARLGLLSIPFYAAAGSAITCVYRDPGGSPNDFVSFIIERLA